MYRQTAHIAYGPNPLVRQITTAPDGRRIVRFTDDDTQEVLEFLNVRPVHTVVMTSFINDNGIESELNRGVFYGYRDRGGKLSGVALIGHSTLVEARDNEALQALAVCARSSRIPIHLIMSSGDDTSRFWSYMGMVGQPRLTCTEVLFEAAFPFAVSKSKYQVRTATPEWLLPVAEAQAEVAFIESGVDPLLSDRGGFLERVVRRIEEGRVFVVTNGDKLVFKADIIAETDETIYLEGIYVAPEHRGKGLGAECLASLTLQLLDRVEHITLLSNVEFTSAHRSFIKAGYRETDRCTSLFL